MISSPQITVKEWRWATGWSIAILLLTCVPYVIAILATPEGWQFAGILVNPLDGHSYMAKLEQGMAGNWLFHLTFTPEPHDGTFINTFYLALGHLAALTGLPKIFIFHLARLIVGFCLLLVAFRFIARVTSHPTERRLAFVLVFSTAGLGWLGAIFGAFPIDLWVPEAFVAYSLYANPHFPLAMTLMLIIFEQVVWVGSSEFRGPNSDVTRNPKSTPTLSLRTGANEIQNLKSVLGAGLAALILAITLPFALLTVWTILAIFLGWVFVLGWFYGEDRRLPWAQIWPTLGVILFSAPVIFYQYWVSVTNPILTGWSAQNITAAPKVLDFLLGYGLVGLLAVRGSGMVIRHNRNQYSTPVLSKAEGTGEWLILLWAVTTVVLVYFPFELQRRLIHGLHLPLCILAAIGLSRWPANSKMKSGYRRLMTMAVVTTGALGTLFVWSLPLIGVLQGPTESATTALFFMRQEEIAAFNWLRTHAKPDEVVLASPRVGMFIPGQTGARAFYGHPFETIEAKTKQAQVEAFYKGEIETISPPVDFIIYGPSEQSLGQPGALSDLPVVFSANDVLIYRVIK